MLDLLKFAEEAGHEPAIAAPLVGVAAFGFLFILLLILLAFGKGREHT